MIRMLSSANPSKGCLGRFCSNEFGMLPQVWPYWQLRLESNRCCRWFGRGTRDFRKVFTTMAAFFNLVTLISVCFVLAAMILSSVDLAMIGDDTLSIGLRRFRRQESSDVLRDFAVDCPRDGSIPKTACDGCIDVSAYPFVIIVLHIPLLPYLIWKQLQRCTPFGDYNCVKNFLLVVQGVLCLCNIIAAAMWFRMCFSEMRGNISIKSGAALWLVSVFSALFSLSFNCLLGTPEGRQDPTPEPYFVDYLMKSLPNAPRRSAELASVSTAEVVPCEPDPSTTPELSERAYPAPSPPIDDYIEPVYQYEPVAPVSRKPDNQPRDDMPYVYVDQRGTIRGPESLHALRSWFNEGKVPPTLLVRRVDWNAWVTLPTALWGSDKDPRL